MIPTDPNQLEHSSELIATLAKHALNNLKIQQRYWGNSNRYREEFGTIKISMPRQSGHSTAALQLLYEYPDSLLFVHSGSARDFMRKQIRALTDDIEVHNRMDDHIKMPYRDELVNIKPVHDRAFIIFDEVLSHHAEAVKEAKVCVDAKIILELH